MREGLLCSGQLPAEKGCGSRRSKVRSDDLCLFPGNFLFAGHPGMIRLDECAIILSLFEHPFNDMQAFTPATPKERISSKLHGGLTDQMVAGPVTLIRGVSLCKSYRKP